MKLNVHNLSLALPLVLAAACGTGSESEQIASTEAELLERDYAGFETNDEARAFGQDDSFRDRGLLDESRDRPVTDANGDVRPDPDPSDVRARVSVSIAWGSAVRDGVRDEAARDAAIQDGRATDAERLANARRWAGGIYSQAAEIGRVHGMALERGDVVERTGGHTIRFHTATFGGRDGVVFNLLLGSGDRDGTLVFESNQISFRVPLRSLVDHQQVLRTDDGAVVSINAHLIRDGANEPPLADCTRAHMRGHWTAARANDGVAHFRGIAYTADGRLGHVYGRAGRGHFGGKIIEGASGDFVALMQGQYRDGHFRGRVRARGAAGYTYGKIGRSDVRNGGWFHGRIVLCATDSAPRDVDVSDMPPERPLPDTRPADDTRPTDEARPTDDTTDGTRGD